MKSAPGRVVLVGATGYTGRVALAELANYELPVLVVGRDVSRLQSVLDEIGTPAHVAYGDATATDPIPDLGPNDVVVSTVGPFSKIGFRIVDSVIAAGASYLDSTGEPPYIHDLFTSRSEAAKAQNATVVPAFGYDYAPGAAAGATVLNRAPSANALRLGYFLTNSAAEAISFRKLKRVTTPATRESLVGVANHPSFAFRATSSPFGLSPEPSAHRLLHFTDEHNRDMRAITVGGGEHFSIPEVFTQVESIDVGLGWLGGLTRPAHIGAAVLGTRLQSPPRTPNLRGHPNAHALEDFDAQS
ncbi:saccharopine dehydrogenase NADP-binding domain-containing protein [Rhodococcus erythropolis]|uniref:saccharopine dehydrogenase NADP-binding domain-containing protein n=1 Tax=Rhodococcus erythropolis TaxID=1833 RepID=UPI00210EF2F9|nr:saccharopine dehydrogenase NADP-binding domain-containing protein [Rhodococcus erythropolis]